MKITPNGHRVGGVAAAGVYVNNARIKDGGTATAGGEWVYYQAVDAALRRCRLGGTEDAPLGPTGISLIVASSTVWAAWTAGTITVTSWGTAYPGWIPMFATEDRAVLLMSYPDPSLGLRLVDASGDIWADPSARGNTLYPYPQAFALDRHRFCWVEPGGWLRVRGLPDPAQPGMVFDPFLVPAPDGTVWIGYHTDRCVLHPLTDPTRGYILSTGYTFGTTATGNTVGWALDQGESVMQSVEVDWEAPRVSLVSTPAPPPPPIPPPPVPPETPMTPDHSTIVRAVYAEGGFKLTSDEGCGLFIEACVRALHAHDPRWGHLIKHAGQRQFRGHAVDAALYRHDTPGQSVAADLIVNSKNPALAAPGWGLDIPRYSSSDWLAPEPCPTSQVFRPSMPFLIAATCFDLGVSRDFALVDELKAAGINTLRIVVASKFRTDRTLEQGRMQLRSLLPKLIERSMKASIVVNCDTAEYGLSELETRSHTAFVNAILRDYPSAVALVELFNENSHGVEQVYASDPYFLRELDALIDPQFPVAWGANHGGEAITDRLAGGSVICFHSDRSLTPTRNALIMAEAQTRFAKPVVNMEPKGIDEVARGDARTALPVLIQMQAQVDKEHKLGGSCYHFEAGLTASSATPPFGPKQREALRLFGVVFTGSTPPPVPPPTGDKVLDAPLTPAYPTGYDFFVNNYEKITDEAEAWYYRAFKRHPAPSDIAHGLWRALNEGERWGTLRGAFEETWPGGGR